jgi:hypothetical protein
MSVAEDAQTLIDVVAAGIPPFDVGPSDPSAPWWAMVKAVSPAFEKAELAKASLDERVSAVQAALQAAGFPAPEPDPAEVAGWRQHYTEE